MTTNTNHPGDFVFQIELKNGVRKRISGDDLTHGGVAGLITVSVRPGDQGMSRTVYMVSTGDVLDVTRLDAEVSVFISAPAETDPDTSRPCGCGATGIHGIDHKES